MEQNEVSQFEDFDKKIIRRELLPIWIKIFCWIFMLMGIGSIACLLFGAFGKTVDLSLYGFETNEPFSMTGLLLIALLSFKGFCTYSLWFEKDYAINICKIEAILGIVICIISMFVMPIINQNSNINIRLELALLIPYYRKLNAIEYAWDNLEEQ